MRRMVPEIQAALRGMMNSKPSHDTRLTYSEGVDSVMVEERVSRVDGGVKNRSEDRLSRGPCWTR